MAIFRPPPPRFVGGKQPYAPPLYAIIGGAAILTADVAETLTLVDASSVTADYAASGVETLTFSESESSGGIFTISTSETLTLVDTANRTAGYVVSVAEVLSLLDIQATGGISIGTITDSLVFSDTQDAVVVRTTTTYRMFFGG